MKVTRDQMIKIHSIACGDWKSKLEQKMIELGLVIGTEAEISGDFVRSMFEAATPSQKEVLNQIFPAEEDRNSLARIDPVVIEEQLNSLGRALFNDSKGIQLARAWAIDIGRPDLRNRAIGFSGLNRTIKVHNLPNGGVVLEFINE